MEKPDAEAVEAVKEEKYVPPSWLIDPRECKWLGYWDGTTSFALIFTAIVTPVEVAFLESADSWKDALFLVRRASAVHAAVQTAAAFAQPRLPRAAPNPARSLLPSLQCCLISLSLCRLPGLPVSFPRRRNRARARRRPSGTRTPSLVVGGACGVTCGWPP